jgi:3-hydroxyacyl-[acyl-carrier-protein] dehydratase
VRQGSAAFPNRDPGMTDLSLHLKLLPHGPEFRFIDRLLSLDPGNQGSAEFSLKGTESFLRGHFPGEPLLPGVLLVEAAAQLAGVVAQSHPNLPPLPELKLTAIRGAKILGTAKPGETIRLYAKIDGRINNLIQASVSADIDGRKILESSLTLSGETTAS